MIRSKGGITLRSCPENRLLKGGGTPRDCSDFAGNAGGVQGRGKGAGGEGR